MITKVNDTNRDEYSVFFGKVSDALDIEINTLAEYFNRLETIKTLGAAYLTLPLDEPMFEIDTNTRNILVPETFRRNGVGVVGDSMAESLFFSVDRYFDIQDLAQDGINIYIQWETPAPNSIKGYSTPWLEDIDSQPGKLIFAWAIPSMLTGTAGNLKFSVRFQQTQNGDIVYDLSTLPQTVKINNGLSFDLGAVQHDQTGLTTITNRLQNSSIGGVFVPQPTFYVCTPANILAAHTLTTASATRDLKVSAYPAGSTSYTTLTYNLSKDGTAGMLSTIVLSAEHPLGEITNTASGVVVASSAYEKTGDAEVNTSKVYYKYDDEEEAYEKVNSTEAAELTVANLYELIITFTVKTAGKYRLSVVGAYAGPDQTTGVNITATSKEAYHSWEFEKPEPFTFGDAVGAATAVFQPTSSGVVNFTADAPVSLTVFTPVDTEDTTEQQNGAEYVATLKRVVQEGEDATVATSTNLVPTSTTDKSYAFASIATNGEYYVEMVKSLNKCATTDAQKSTSRKILITEALAAPVVSRGADMVTDVVAVGSQLSCTDTLTTEANGFAITKTYQWYKSTSGSTKPTLGPVDGSNIRTGWEAVRGATNAAFVPTQAGYYSLVVTVSRNGSLQRGDGPIFTAYQI